MYWLGPEIKERLVALVRNVESVRRSTHAGGTIGVRWIRPGIRGDKRRFRRSFDCRSIDLGDVKSQFLHYRWKPIVHGFRQDFRTTHGADEFNGVALNLIEPYAKLCVLEEILNHKSYLSTGTTNPGTLTKHGIWNTENQPRTDFIESNPFEWHPRSICCYTSFPCYCASQA
jgi:hypothetical protein